MPVGSGILTLYFKVLFMTDEKSLEDLREIRQMMDRSTRFISLSGWSGVAAGTCALIASWFAHGIIARAGINKDSFRITAPGISPENKVSVETYLGQQLLHVALITLVAAVTLAFLFTWLRTRRTNTKIWSPVTRKVLWALALPLVVGGIYLLEVLHSGAWGLMAPGSLLFYGLALVGASRYTVSEIRFLGYGQLLTGIVALFFPGYGLYFWAFGFGLLHIVYGLLMWWKHERVTG